MVEKYWKAVIRVSLTDVRRHGFYSSLNEAERFYVGCLLSNLTDMFFDMIEGKVPEPIVKASHKTVVRDPRNLCAKIRHIVRGNIGKFPNANNWNCCVYDEDSYVVKEECGKQVIELMSKVPRQRICVPVVGNGPLSRTIKLYQRGETFYLSVPSQSEVKELENIPKTVGDNKLWAESLDLGITEIFTSCENKRFGIGFGKMVNQYATMVSNKMFNRGKAIEAYEGSQGDKQERIKRCCLGNDTFRLKIEAERRKIIDFINASINELFEKLPADVYVVEKLQNKIKPWTSNFATELLVKF